MAEEDNGKKKREVVVESLGWLTESSVMPKKHKAIEGVGASSIMELRAELYKEQEETRKSRDLAGTNAGYHRAKKKITPNDTFSRKNSGVDARAHGDKLALKAETDGSASYAALEKKAELYEKLVRGELSDEDDTEKYCVDFFRKGIMQEEGREPHTGNPSPPQASGKDVDEEDAFTSVTTKPLVLGRAVGTVDNDERKRLVREVHEEATEARVRASEIKLRREAAEAARRAKLKQAFLRKKLESLKTASKIEQTSPTP